MYLRKTHKCSLLITFMALIGWFISTANAGYWVYQDEDYDYDYFRSDRLSREHRDAGDVDDWLERGNSTITESPIFTDGIRLTAWASDYENDDEFDFAIASAVYLFEVPGGAQYIEIKVRYKGNGRESEFDDFEEAAGRIWVRNLEKEQRQNRYDDDERETLYGDTFLLRAKRRSETIKIPAAHHVNSDGFMEVHAVVEGDQLLNIEYIDVTSYQRQPRVRIIHRHLPAYGYSWRPWYNYTYTYFYDGPCHYTTDYGYYVRWSYPVFSRDYLVIRANYSKYLGSYYRRYPRLDRHYYTNKHVNVHIYKDEPDKTRQRQRLNAWTPKHETVRKVYDRSRLTKTKSASAETRQMRSQVRATIQTTRTKPVLSKRVIQPRSERIKQRRIGSTTRPGTEPRSSIMRHGSKTSQPERSIRVTQPERDKTKREIRSKSSSSSSESKSTRSKIIDAIKRRRSKSNSKASSSVSSSPAKKQDTSKKEDDDDDDDEDEDEEEEKKKENRESRTKRRR